MSGRWYVGMQTVSDGEANAPAAGAVDARIS
jgi:hypothetical protein